MNANAKKWVAALRSGEYEQARGTLTKDGGFCCLGVACVLAAAEDVIESSLIEEKSVLPKAVKLWLGLNSVTGITHEAPYGSLSNLNDLAKFDFNQIADVIESEPAGLFT